MTTDDNASDSPAITLSELEVGQRATVMGINGAQSDPVSRRLADLGFLAGTPIQALRRAPLGDPTVYLLRNYQMCLRRREARRILVQRAA